VRDLGQAEAESTGELIVDAKTAKGLRAARRRSWSAPTV
jgi:hypothetical protein